MAETTVSITVKPESGKFTSSELRDELDNIDALADLNAVRAEEIVVRLDTDYDDDSRVIIATWSV